MTTETLTKELLYDHKQLTALFKNVHPDFCDAIDEYFANDCFLPATEMARIIQHQKYSERLLYVHVNMQITAKTGHKDLTNRDKSLRKCACEFLSGIFRQLGFQEGLKPYPVRLELASAGTDF